MNHPVSITSDHILDDVDQNLRVFAGPGAGKTHWLINHIRNVICSSTRLSSVSRVACISYTNVAVSEIIERLGDASDRVEASTIHSFLYKHVVKPYLHLVRDDNGGPLVNFVDVDGHDEHVPSYKKVETWLGPKLTKILLYDQQKRRDAFKRLRSIAWHFDETSAEWKLGVEYPMAYLPTKHMWEYKRLYWEDGVLDHDDVLYFAYRILSENPILRSFLSARFRYMFVDEFQDTNPVQTLVVKWLADSGTTVGVVGDVEQSIYSFQGARYKHFRDFSVSGLIDYEIVGNRRSTDSIISLLNHLRQDGHEQCGLRKVPGDRVRLCVGDPRQVALCITEKLLNPDGAILARKNELANVLRQSTGATDNKLWVVFEDLDRDRSRFMEQLIAAGELAHREQYTLAVSTLSKGIRIGKDGAPREPLKSNVPITEHQRRGLTVSLLEFLMSDYGSVLQSTLLDVYSRIALLLPRMLEGLSIKGVSSGKFKDFASVTLYGDLAGSVRLTEETRGVRTIHKAKGTEFPATLICLENESDLEHVIAPHNSASDDRKSEDRRVIYVAMSRAEDHLVLSVPSLSQQSEQSLIALGLDLKHCSQCSDCGLR